MVLKLGGLGTIASYHSCSNLHSNLDRTNVFFISVQGFRREISRPLHAQVDFGDVLANRVTIISGKGHIIYCRWDYYM